MTKKDNSVEKIIRDTMFELDMAGNVNSVPYCTRSLVVLCESVSKLKAENARLRDVARAFKEYFGAIERGEYINNGRAKRLRSFETVLLRQAEKALAEGDGCGS